MECLDTVDLQTLRDACKANGLPTSGTKLDCFHRLQAGVGDGRKNKKGKGAGGAPKAMDGDVTSPPSPAFIAKEYAALNEAGIEEEEEIENIINMRWKKMQALKMASEAEEVQAADVEEEDAEAPTFIKIPLKLTSEQAATSNYIFVSGPDDENNFLYKKVSDKPDPAAKPVAKVAASSKAASKAVVKAVPAKAPAKTFTSPAPGKKRKEPEPEPEPEPLSADDPAFQQAAIQFCMKQMKSRVMAKIKAKRLKKENLFDFILAFDAGTKGTTDNVVDTFVEQSLCETDDEDDE